MTSLNLIDHLSEDILTELVKNISPGKKYGIFVVSSFLQEVTLSQTILSMDAMLESIYNNNENYRKIEIKYDQQFMEEYNKFSKENETDNHEDLNFEQAKFWVGKPYLNSVEKSQWIEVQTLQA
ncbi:unnamed protein product, partial [marine sediment metagenome]